MVEAHTGSGSGTAIMAGDKEFAVAERLHNLDLVLCHRPERIVDVVFAAVLGPHTVAVAAQISGDDVKSFGETVGDLVPGNMSQRVAVQQQQRRAVAPVPQMNAGAARGDLRPSKAFEHSALRRCTPLAQSTSAMGSCVAEFATCRGDSRTDDSIARA